MAAYYGVFKQPTQEDFRRYQLMQGNADPTPLSYEEWLTRPGQGERIGGRLSREQARAIAKQTPGSSIVGMTGGSNPLDQFGEMIGGLADEPGVQALALAGGAGVLGPSLMGGGYAGTGAGAGLTEEMAMLGIGDAGVSGGLAAAGGAVPGLAEEAAMLGIGDAFPGGSSVLQGLGGAAAIKSLVPGLGDIFDGIGDFLPSGDTALAMAPILAAINYAKNTDPFDTSRLRSIYNEFDPSSLAYEYDQNTNAGRSALTSSLSNRGVMGSSFGNMDLTNFQTSRDLGRQSLLNQGLAQKGNIASSILDADVKHRALKNDLYGRSLLALGNVFGGRNQ